MDLLKGSTHSGLVIKVAFGSHATRKAYFDIKAFNIGDNFSQSTSPHTLASVHTHSLVWVHLFCMSRHSWFFAV